MPGSTGASRALLLAALDGEVFAVASTVLMLEYEDVLLRSGRCGRRLPALGRAAQRPSTPSATPPAARGAALRAMTRLVAHAGVRDERNVSLPGAAGRFAPRA